MASWALALGVVGAIGGLVTRTIWIASVQTSDDPEFLVWMLVTLAAIPAMAATLMGVFAMLRKKTMVFRAAVGAALGIAALADLADIITSGWWAHLGRPH